MRQRREPFEVEIPIIVQDPRRTPDAVRVKVRGPLLAGPIGERMAVFDYHADRDVVFPAATPRADGTFPDYDIDDVRFHQPNVYAIAARATELVELELGRPLRWGFDGSRLSSLTMHRFDHRKSTDSFGGRFRCFRQRARPS